MIKSKLKKIIAISLASLSLISVVSSSSANTNKNTDIDKHINITSRGYGDWITIIDSYQGRPGAHYTSTGVYGTQSTKSTTTVAASRLGAHCNLYRQSDDAILRTADWSYNNAPVSTYTNSTAKVTSKGTYYARGTSKVFYNNSYITKWCGQSSVAQILSLDIDETEKQERLKLYETKNMIKAVGLNNVEGYIIESELYDEENQPKTPQEATLYMNKRAKSNIRYRLIPLYHADGETIIGEYKIDF